MRDERAARYYLAKTSADMWYRPKVMVQYVEAEIKKNAKISLKLDAWCMFKFKLTKPINISNYVDL